MQLPSLLRVNPEQEETIHRAYQVAVRYVETLQATSVEAYRCIEHTINACVGEMVGSIEQFRGPTRQIDDLYALVPAEFAALVDRYTPTLMCNEQPSFVIVKDPTLKASVSNLVWLLGLKGPSKEEKPHRISMSKVKQEIEFTLQAQQQLHYRAAQLRYDAAVEALLQRIQQEREFLTRLPNRLEYEFVYTLLVTDDTTLQETHTELEENLRRWKLTLPALYCRVLDELWLERDVQLRCEHNQDAGPHYTLDRFVDHIKQGLDSQAQYWSQHQAEIIKQAEDVSRLLGYSDLQTELFEETTDPLYQHSVQLFTSGKTYHLNNPNFLSPETYKIHPLIMRVLRNFELYQLIRNDYLGRNQLDHLALKKIISMLTNRQSGSSKNKANSSLNRSSPGSKFFRESSGSLELSRANDGQQMLTSRSEGSLKQSLVIDESPIDIGRQRCCRVIKYVLIGLAILTVGITVVVLLSKYNIINIGF